jgi:HAE1 family hydrophobic/amphiphilic exporter-1
VNVALRNSLKDVNLTGGATYKIGGVSADQEKAFADLALALLAAIVIVFSIMVATFRTFVQPLILLISIPFAATGALDAAHPAAGADALHDRGERQAARPARA